MSRTAHEAGYSLPDTTLVRVGRDVADDSVVVVTLDRPEQLNALNVQLLGELHAIVRHLRGLSSVRAMVLTGAGRAFSAGADLQAPAMGADEALRCHYNPLVRSLIGFDKPIVAAVNGVAAGAALSLCLACDLRVAAESATFQMAFVKVGLVPDAGATWLLPRVVGASRAAEMAILGRSVGAGEAQDWGLVNEVVPDAQCLGRALELGRQIASMASSTGAIRGLLWQTDDQTFEAALEAEVVAQVSAQGGPDWTEAVSAFKEKRRPRFR
jgi:2-(1,2-epoxy-1,2-dihydrophenyl)acetyl-CoA isomerase